MFVVGKVESANPAAGLVSVRHRHAGDFGTRSLDDVIPALARLAAERSLVDVPEGWTPVQKPGGVS